MSRGDIRVGLGGFGLETESSCERFMRGHYFFGTFLEYSELSDEAVYCGDILGQSSLDFYCCSHYRDYASVAKVAPVTAGRIS